MFAGYSVDIGQSKLYTSFFNGMCLFQKIYIFKIHKNKNNQNNVNEKWNIELKWAIFVAILIFRHKATTPSPCTGFKWLR